MLSFLNVSRFQINFTIENTLPAIAKKKPNGNNFPTDKLALRCVLMLSDCCSNSDSAVTPCCAVPLNRKFQHLYLFWLSKHTINRDNSFTNFPLSSNWLLRDCFFFISMALHQIRVYLGAHLIQFHYDISHNTCTKNNRNHFKSINHVLVINKSY